MKTFGVRSVSVQLIILFAAVLVLSQILGVGFRNANQRETLSVLESIRIADRVTTILPLMERTAPEERGALAEFFTGPNYHVTWDLESRVAADHGGNADTQRLAEILAATGPESALREFRIVDRQSTAAESGRRSPAEPLPALVGQVADELVAGPNYVIAARLDDGSWLNVTAAYAETLDIWSPGAIVIVCIMVVAIVALAIWAIRRLTSPFQTFARAATRLGTDVKAPPIEERGPSEVRLAIVAFNEMQDRIRRFIEDRTQMLAAISHDLRTPITRVRLRAEFVEDEEERRKMLADFDEMERMVASVLDFAKGDSDGEPTARVDLVAMLQRICDEMADRGCDVTLVATGHRSLSCRPLAMRRCFTNLIDNAVKYGNRAIVDIEAGDQAIRIHVDDEGPGIAEARYEQAFRPFDRLDRSKSRDGGGSGLGLTVARSIARAHGGDVILTARPAGGLRASVHLPVGIRA